MLHKIYKTAFLFLFTLSLQAQYTVSGGNGAPLLALDDIPDRLQVYLVYGMDNVEISYTSASPSHQWFRYKVKALEAEPVPSVQEGTTSALRQVEEGYGYFVKETEAIGSNSFVWIIDYSKYAFDIRQLQIVAGDDPCYEVRLEGTATLPKLAYCIPAGVELELARKFEILYNTLEWDNNEREFSPKALVQTVEKTPFYRSLSPPPLTDTDIQLKGDLFARHFGVEKSMSVNYQATAIEAYIDTTVVSTDVPNRVPGTGAGYSAPAELSFTAKVNTPVVTFYRWNIINTQTGENLRVENSESFNFTFLTAGKYAVTLEVKDRSNTCEKTDSVIVDIGDSYLKIPNAFSPGASPGVNDEFRVAYKSLVSFKAWIFNRWGVELFRWDDPAKGWDGKKGGSYVPPGVYFYIIEARGSDGRQYKEKGSINIIRPKNVQDQIVE
ncbi:MAG: gliding motility-associated C-terminal domain-containing protein [Tannerellaceae bacterium]|jgi:gliding motility-associated-like protein|nr:gliding motility-associated C-terminal domain-containing protein [Tannerellaceae bacterium]